MTDRFGAAGQIATLAAVALVAGVSLATPARADESAAVQWLPTGQRLTPQAATGAMFQDLDPGLTNHPEHRAGQAVTTVASHNGKTLLVLTSGFNRVSTPEGKKDDDASNEYVFVFDISSRTPKQ